MSGNAERDDDDVALLLPWYATGRLDPAERARVERFLADNPGEREHLLAVEEEREAAQALSRAAPGPSPGSIETILAATRREARRSPARRESPAARLLAAIGGLLDALAPPTRGAALAALALLVLVQAGALGVMIGAGPGATRFETASGEASAPAAAPAILVAFAPSAPAGEVARLLEEAGARIVDGPRAGGVFALALREGADAQAALAALRARPDLVLFAAPGA